jgi:hypothetical protein
MRLRPTFTMVSLNNNNNSNNNPNNHNNNLNNNNNRNNLNNLNNNNNRRLFHNRFIIQLRLVRRRVSSTVR